MQPIFSSSWQAQIFANRPCMHRASSPPNRRAPPLLRSPCGNCERHRRQLFHRQPKFHSSHSFCCTTHSRRYHTPFPSRKTRRPLSCTVAPRWPPNGSSCRCRSPRPRPSGSTRSACCSTPRSGCRSSAAGLARAPLESSPTPPLLYLPNGILCRHTTAADPLPRPQSSFCFVRRTRSRPVRKNIGNSPCRA